MESRSDQTSRHLPYMTEAIPGVGGQLKSVPEDFVVEEVPVFQPCGMGDHLYLWIEKRDVAAEQLVKHFAQTLSISRQDVGIAGMKDRRAVTHQYVSLPAHCADNLSSLETELIRILRVERHRHKLRTGQLRGNRFSILLRNVLPNSADSATRIRDLLVRRGLPNFFGDQRFGQCQGTLDLGLDLLTARRSDRELPKPRRKFLKRLSLSAVQSWLFNQSLTNRIRDGLIQQVWVGDVMQKIESGGCFLAENREEEQKRFATRETTVTGPIFGHKMLQPQGMPGQREVNLLEQNNLDADVFLRFKKLTRGARRAYLLFIEKLDILPETDGLRFEFTLPKGSYATVLMREFMKID